MLYYEIIPLTKIPLARKPYFTYSSKDALPNGSLVEIDFARKKLRGVVSRECRRPFFATKPILKTITLSLITEKQLELASRMSEFYCTPLGVALKFFIPPLAQKRHPDSAAAGKTAENISDVNASGGKTLTLTPSQKKAAAQILKSPGRQFLLFGPASAGKTEVMMEVIRSVLGQGRQALVMIPEVFLSYQEIERYTARFSSQVPLKDKKINTVLIHSAMKPVDFISAYEGIQKGSVDIVISTRLGLFLPFKKLGLIVVDEEQDLSHKQWDQSPRYHVRQTAPMLARLHQAKILYASATPSMEILGSVGQGVTREIDLPMLQVKNLTVCVPSIEIIDLRKYYFRNKNRPVIISDELKKSLQKNFDEKKIAMVLVSRQGKSKAVICTDCRKTLLCPRCDSQLVGSGDNYICLHCSHKIPSLAKCPHCGSYRLKQVGFGTEKAADEIAKLFPQARISIADAKHFQNEQYRAELFESLYRGKIDIIIGSQSIAKGFDIPRIGLVALLNADTWAGQTDFRYDERWLGQLFQICGRLNRPASDQRGKAIIQTFRPDNPLLTHLKAWDWRLFANEEQMNRQALLYPPHSHLIKLIFKHTDKKKVEKNAQAVYNMIMELSDGNSRLANGNVSVEKPKILSVMEPYYGTMKKQRDKWQKNILVKVTSLDHPELKKVFNSISKDWIIDINPEGIFS